jgi:hypothetical protein
MGRRKKEIHNLRRESLRIVKSKLKTRRIENFTVNRSDRAVIREVSTTLDAQVTHDISTPCSPSSSDEITEINDRIDSKKSAQNEEHIDQWQNHIQVNESPIVTAHVRSSIQRISLTHNFSRVGVSELLKELNPFFPSLAQDYRTLLNTPRTTVLRTVSPGDYVHLGIEQNVLRIFSFQRNIVNSVTLDFFVDGVAFYDDSKKKSFWVILGRCLDTIFPIGIYNGVRQPDKFNCFLQDLINELVMLTQNGIFFRGNNVRVAIGNFCLDSPARASVCYVTHPTGYSSCHYCTIIGRHDGARVVFEEYDCEKRTDYSIRNKIDLAHHHKKYTSEIQESLKIDMVKQFPPGITGSDEEDHSTSFWIKWSIITASIKIRL